MSAWEEAMTGAGYRITAPRRTVMQVLMAAEAPLSPQEILERARRHVPQLGLVTVYRTLSLATDLKLVRRVHYDNGCHGYLLSSPGHHHALVCQRCSRAVEFAGEEDLHELIRRVEQATGFRVEGHLLQLFGLCAECQEAEGRRDQRGRSSAQDTIPRH